MLQNIFFLFLSKLFYGFLSAYVRSRSNYTKNRRQLQTKKNKMKIFNKRFVQEKSYKFSQISDQKSFYCGLIIIIYIILYMIGLLILINVKVRSNKL